MKSLIKILNNSTVFSFVGIVWLIMLYCNHKFFIICCIMSPIAVLTIWWLNWDFFKIKYNKLTESEKEIEIKFGKLLWVVAFIFDMVSWPLVLISSSKIILVEEMGEDNV